LLAGLASGIYKSADETVAIAPKFELVAAPGVNASAYSTL
jgi:hypothetical protein